MAWRRRREEDANIYQPYEHPGYQFPEQQFTIKLFYNGKIEENPKNYVGGSVAYVDFCDSDEMSLLEINAMLVSLGAMGGLYKLWYKLPGTTMDAGLFDLDTDDELLLMCDLINPEKRVVEVYVNITPALNVERATYQEEIHMDDPFPFPTQQEIEMEADLRNAEGLYEDFSDPYDSEDDHPNGAVEDETDESFHCDGSNQDTSDDDLLFDKNVDKTVHAEDDKEAEDADLDENEDEGSDKSSVYAESDDERVVANSTDEDEKTCKVDLARKSCTCMKWELTGIPCYHACACISLKNEPWEMHIDSCYTKDMYLKLYSNTLEPIAGPEFWHQTSEPRPLPPNVRIAAGRPKKKRSTRNDIPQDPEKLSKVGTIINCTYCKAQGHNARTCAAKRTDLAKKAAEQGTTPVVPRSTVVCKTCKQQGHNSRTCALKTHQARDQNQPTIPEQMQQGTHQSTQASSTTGIIRKKLVPKRRRDQPEN